MSNFLGLIKSFFKRTDHLLIFLCLLASSLGILFVSSATRYKGQGVISSDVRTMLAAVILGFVIAIIMSLLDSDIYLKLMPFIVAVSIILMIAVMLFGVAPQGREDSKIWLDLKLFYFQPSELLKVAFILSFSYHLGKIKDNLNRPLNVFLIFLHAIVPFGLVAISGDDGSALVFLLLSVAMVFVAGINWKYMVSSIVLILAALPLLWLKLSTFQKQRFYVLFKPEEYPNVAYQQNRAADALRSGGFTGSGLFKGIYTQNYLVPEAENDFIFSVVCEESGMIGALFVLLLFILIILKILFTAKKARDFSAKMICYGVAFLISIQILINVSMVLRLGPVIGITLPFFSAGGSSTLCMYLAIGLVLSVYHTNSYQPIRTVRYRVNTR
ncbi:MAG: FtsW/RodA/SpoVE family cell cycle protein [Clostridia bacterium]|nr:FtsW/RodA/SpoVE family cell cycle protein [Clostridia bacterium]